MNDKIQEYVREALLRSTNDLDNLSTDMDIEEYLNKYDSSQAEGVLNNIKGITHELYYEDMENSDGDSIFAELHADVNHPGSDVTLTDLETGETFEAQLKATDSSDYVLDAIEDHPDVHMISTEEVSYKLNLDSSGISNEELTEAVSESLSDYGLEGLEPETADYIEMTHVAEQEALESGFLEEFGDSLGTMGNAALTGGFYALLQFFKDNPEKQKKVVDVALTAGIIDGVVDFGEFGLESGFDINPLFIASLASWISIRGMQSSNEKISNFSSSFAYTTTKAMKVVEYGSYAAIGAEVLDLITGVDIVESVVGALELADVLDLVDGADLLDGLASFGLGLIASKGVKMLMDKYNERDRKKIVELQKRYSAREMFRKMLKEDLPVPLLLGPYDEMR